MHVGTDGEELMDGEAIDKYNKGESENYEWHFVIEVVFGLTGGEQKASSYRR